MWNYYPELLETPVPRYTSFPTAAEFGSGIGAEDVEAALQRARGDVSLYLHVPFCEKICWYCGCNTGAANKTQRLASYLDALHREYQADQLAQLAQDLRKIGGSFGLVVKKGCRVLWQIDAWVGANRSVNRSRSRRDTGTDMERAVI